MKIYTFVGGVHPPTHKRATADIPITVMPIPKELVIPVIQHTGAPCQVLIKKGDKVLTGQKIGDHSAFISAPIHASTSGEVTDVKLTLHPLGLRIQSIFIKPDQKDTWVEPITKSTFDDVTSQDIIKKIRDSGIVGLGGAAFPTQVKLSPPSDKTIDTVIINGVECEPYLTADYRLMIEHAEKIIAGIKLIIKALNVTKAFCAIEDNKPKAITRMIEALKNEKNITVVSVKTKYPQGSEKQLIEALTKRKVPMGKLPLDVGVVVQNVGTAKAIADAVLDGKPLIERVVTVAGSNIKKPSNLLVRIGTKYSDIIAFCGGTYEPIAKIIMGGPMMGIAVPSLEVPVIKGTSGIIVLKEKDVLYVEPGNCIRCGKCLEVCPMGLAPGRFVESGELKDYDRALQDNVLNCMECGACSYVCPARRPMVHWIKLAKLNIQKRLKQKKQ